MPCLWMISYWYFCTFVCFLKENTVKTGHMKPCAQRKDNLTGCLEMIVLGFGAIHVKIQQNRIERFAAQLEYSEWFPGRLFTALLRVVNLCHLGTTASTYRRLLMCLWHLEHTFRHTVSMNESQISLSSLAPMCCIPEHNFPIGRHSHLWFPTYTLYSICIPACLPVCLPPTWCQKHCTSTFPKEAGSKRACLVPALFSWEQLTSLLISQVILGDTSTPAHSSVVCHTRPVTKEEFM